jgi:hypothetical protein
VFDDTPLDYPRDLRAKHLARNFRRAAEEFLADKFEHLSIEQMRLEDQCGQWLIQAQQLGLLSDFPQLCKIVAWHAAPESSSSTGYVRCTTNLFLDICGGNQIKCRRTEDGLSFELDEKGQPQLSGGLYPRLLPGHLKLSVAERKAETCSALADLLERQGAGEARVPETQSTREAPSRKRQTGTNGPEPPNRLWWNNQKHLIGTRAYNLSWKLLDYFWDRDSAAFEDLNGEGKPWGNPVSDSAICTAVARFNNEPWPSGFHWKLSVCQGEVVRVPS